jgi:hypothetical protein
MDAGRHTRSNYGVHNISYQKVTTHTYIRGAIKLKIVTIGRKKIV